jgi:hypothetical protein
MMMKKKKKKKKGRRRRKPGQLRRLVRELDRFSKDFYYCVVVSLSPSLSLLHSQTI